MSENQKRVLEMLRDKKITVEEAERLLSLIGTGGNNEETLPATAEPEKKRAPKYLRVVVTEGSPDGDRVNVRVPVSLIRAGMKFTSLIPPLAADKVNEAFKEQGIEFNMRNFKPEDVDELIEALSDFEVNVDSGDGDKVRVYTE